MKKLLVLIFVGLMVASCVTVKRPGLEMKATIDTRAVKTATDPQSDYMGYFGKLVDKNKDSYISCNENGSCTYMPTQGKGMADLLQKGIWENETNKSVQIEIRKAGTKETVQTLTIAAKGFKRLALLPGDYEHTVKAVGETPRTYTWRINLQKGDGYSKIANEWTDFVRTTTVTP